MSAQQRRPHGAQEYKGNGNHKWETASVGFVSTMRLRVPGGWLYRYGSGLSTDGTVSAMVFVPVPDVVGYAI